MKRFSISIILLAATGNFFPALWSQSKPEWVAPLPAANQTGYHRINLPPMVTCRLNGGYGNIRIMDPSGSDVPYIFNEEKSEAQDIMLKYYPRVGSDDIRWHYTRSYFMNPDRTPIREMVLKVRNADVRRRFWLSGSDDMGQWYIIKEDYVYDAFYDATSAFTLLTISFPPSDYKYYKVEVQHDWREPIQILGAGYYDISKTDAGYARVPDPAIGQEDRKSEKQSVITMDFGAPHYLDHIFFVVDGPEFYQRTADIAAEVIRADGSRVWQVIQSFDLTSRNTNMLDISRRQAQRMKLTIHNKDDKPLRVAAVRGFQTRKYLTAKLESGKSYEMQIGSLDQQAPEYDLVYFKKELPKTMPVLAPDSVSPVAAVISGSDTTSIGAAVIRTIPEEAPKVDKQQEKENEMVFLWIAIGVIVVVLGFFSFRMLREKPTEDHG